MKKKRGFPPYSIRCRGHRCPGAFFCSFVLLSFFLLALPCAPARALEEYANPSEGILSMAYENGRLSVTTKEAPMESVLEKIAQLAGLTVTADGPVEDRITVHIDNLPTDAAVKKILRGKDVTLLYTKTASASKAKEFKLSEVRIFIAEGDKGQGRVYSFAKTPPADRTSSARPRSRRGASPVRPTRPRPDRDEERDTPYPSARDHAERFLSGLMEGDFDALNEMAEKIKEENPEVRDQIDQFVESLEEARENAEEGNPNSSLMGLGNLGLIMQEMVKDRE